VAERAIRPKQGTLYPALVRLERKGWIKGAWQTTENNREARYYTITRSGVRALAEQAALVAALRRPCQPTADERDGMMGSPRRFLWPLVSLMRSPTDDASVRREIASHLRLITAVLLKALPYRDPADLVVIGERSADPAHARPHNL
jgi:DNA-binding PadR family transcriptional regulator